MKTIRSRDNPLARQLMRLMQSNADRQATGLTVLEGIHLAQVWSEGAGLPHEVVVSEAGRGHPEIRALLHQVPERQQVVLSDALFRQCSSIDPPVGILAIVPIPRLALPEGSLAPCLMLERVQDPGNLGTLLRSAAAAGIDRVLLSTGCAQAWSPRVLRSGMGAHRQLAIHEGVDLEAEAGRRGQQLVAATLEGSLAHFDADLTGPVALLVGNEGAGLSAGLLRHAAMTVRIPMAPGMESLNAAVAGSLLMFERVRQIEWARRAQADQ